MDQDLIVRYKTTRKSIRLMIQGISVGPQNTRIKTKKRQMRLYSTNKKSLHSGENNQQSEAMS